MTMSMFSSMTPDDFNQDGGEDVFGELLVLHVNEKTHFLYYFILNMPMYIH
jgi:hypothetical protein